MAGIFSLRNWVMKQLMKQDKSGIMRIPDKGKIDFGEMLLREQLFTKGIDPKTIKNEKQLDNIINTPVVSKSERVKPKKSGEVIEVDFDKNKNWFKGKSEGTKSLFATDKEFADELRSLRLNIIRNDPQFNLEIAESYKLPGGKTYAPYPDEEPGKLLSPTQRQNMLDEIKNLMKDDEYRSQFGGDFNFEEITDEMFRIKKARGGRTGLSYLLAEDTNERMPFALGKIVKGGKWLIKSLRGTREQLKTMNMSPGQLKYYLDQIDDQIKNIEAGGKIPDEVIQTIRSDPKFKSVWQNQLSADPDLREMEEVLLEYGQKHAEGGITRMPFKMGRRAFLKLMGGAGAAIGAAKAGLGSLFKAGKPVAKQLTSVPIGNPEGMPSWFKPLVNKVIKEGEDVTEKFATKERQIVHTKKLGDPKADDVYADEVTVTQDLDTGNVRVEYHSGTNMGEAPIQLDYKAAEIVEPDIATGKGGGTIKEEFTAIESEPRVANWDGDIEWDGENVVGKVDELLSDTTQLEAYATGKRPTIKKLLESEQKQKRVQRIMEDQGNQVDYIETKYGPGPDPTDYDDWPTPEYASGGLAKMLGE